MEQVFPVEINVSSSSVNLRRGSAASVGFKVGVVEKMLEPGSFIVTLADGLRVKVEGSKALKLGSRVQVQLPATRTKGTETLLGADQPKNMDENSLHWSALIPLGFGGKDAKASLEVFVERRAGGAWDKIVPAVYFVFVVHTKELGEIQWSIHMKGRHVALQVFAPLVDNSQKALRDLVLEVEKSLKNRGFVISGPTVYLNRPFKVPVGFRLNVRG
jgi:hypothetical protein